MEAAKVNKIKIRGSTTIEELFDIIESAIEVATTKYPQEFSNRKSKVLELLSAPSSLVNTDQEVKPNLLKLKIKGQIISNVSDERYMEHSVINISPPIETHHEVMIKKKEEITNKNLKSEDSMEKPVKISSPLLTHQEVMIKKKEEITNNSEKLEASKRKIAERYMEAKKARKTIQVLELCNLPKQDFSVKKKVPTRPSTFRRRL